MPELDRITQDPAVMGGKPCIRGMRVTVGMVVGQIGAGRSIEDVLADLSLPRTRRYSASAPLRRLASRRARGHPASCMKLLIDMNLSPRWGLSLVNAGWQAKHWSEIGKVSASDSEILAYAAANDYVVLTHDLDFGSILAITHGKSLASCRSGAWISALKASSRKRLRPCVSSKPSWKPEPSSQ
jgi:uncharacterized protein (DUF433 family)